MRPKKPQTTGEGDVFRARLDQIINIRHALVARQQDGLDHREIAPLCGDKGWPGIETPCRWVVAASSHLRLSDEGVF